jgi:hypothetical protein
MVLRNGYLALAHSIQARIQEATQIQSQKDVRSALDDCISDCFRGTGTWGYYIDHIVTDDASGFVIYSTDGDTRKAPYTISITDGNIAVKVDTAASLDVIPVVSYIEEMEESGKTKPGGDALALRESVPFTVDIPLRESIGTLPIKLIAPGKGSSAFYPAEVLKRDGPAIFKAGTPMCIDHPTAAEESQRPEGSVNNWGGVLATDAVWMDNHAQGPGLYGTVKPFSDHAATLTEKGPYAGVSIRAFGEAAKENGKVLMRDGVPVLAKLTAAESVDIVTRAGAGGMFLSESARNAGNGGKPKGEEMTEAQLKMLEAAGRLVARDAAGIVASRKLSDVTLSAEAKAYVVSECMHSLPIKDGVLDEELFGLMVTEKAKSVGALLSAHGGGEVRGMGAGGGVQPVALTEAQLKAAADAEAAALKESESIFLDLMEGNETAGKLAAKGRY